MNTPKISIITVSYNAVETIEQTIASVCSQTYPNYEYIIIDGGSTDGTVDIIKKYNDKIVYWISENDNGIYDAMQKGIACATGEYIEIIGADDCYCDKNSLTDLVLLLEHDVDILSACEWAVYDNGMQYVYSNANAIDKDNYSGGMVPHAAMLVRKKIYIKYPFDKSYKIAADYKFFLECYTDKDVTIKYVKNIPIFFSMSGVSSNYDMCKIENKRIYEELRLNYDDNCTDENILKKYLKILLLRLRLLDKIVYFINTNLRLKKHRCNNKICRWCGRKL